MIPVLFERDEVDFQTNGLGQLPNVIDSYAHEIGNADYELNLVYPTVSDVDGYSNDIWKELKVTERQILYKPSHNRNPHAFRIYNYEIDSIAQTITVYARSRAYDLGNNVVKVVNINKQTPQTAMNTMKNNLVEPTDFDFYSDMTTTSSTKWERQSGLSTIMGEEGSLIQYWGGEVLRENTRISLYNRIGRDNVTTLRLGKNIQQLNYDLRTDSMVTAIIPYYRYTPEGENQEEQVVIGNTVKSPNFNSYRLPYYQFVEYNEQDDNVTNLTTLNNVASKWFKENLKSDEPTLTINVDMVDVAESTEYANLLKALEQVNVFDTVSVYVSEYDIDMVIKVVSLKYDGFNERNLEVELGSATKGMFDSILGSQFVSIGKQLEDIKKMGIIAQISADGKNTNYHGTGDPNEIGLIGNDGDIYFRTVGTEKQMWQYQDGQWDLILDTSRLDIVKKEVEDAIVQADADRLKAEADFESAIITGKEYTDTKASEFNTEMEVVKTDLVTTKTKADKAVLDAETAITEAGFAKLDAGTAKQNANEAKTNASTALTTAQTSLTNSGTAISTANTALDAYKNMEIGGRNLLKGTNVSSTLIGNGELNQYSDSYSFAVDTRTFLGKQITTSFKWKIEGTTSATGTFYIQGNYPYPQLSGDEVRIDVSLMNGEFARTTTLYGESNVGFTGARIRMDNVTVGAKLIVYDLKIEYGNKSTTWTTAPEDVQVQITDINGELAKKVSQTTFNTLSGTVTSQSTQISQSQTAIGLKADKSLVDTINQTVANHTLSIKATADGLAAKAEKSLVDSLNGTVSSHTSLINLNAEGLALKADSSKVDTLSGTVATHTGQISANSTAIGLRLTSAQVETAITAKNYVNQTTLNATSTGLTAQITQVSNDLNNMEIGGRNLIIRKDERKSTILGPSGGVESGVGSLPKDKIAVVTGESLMFSKNTVTGDNNWRIHWYDASGVFINRTATATNKIQWIAPTNARYVWASYPNDAKVKIERGTKATDWSPAPEDMATVDNFTTLEATVNGINTVVGNKADQSQITQLAGQISSKVDSSAYTTKMTQLDSSINLRLESSKVISQINLSTEGILLQGKRIQLDGDVTMTSAFVDRLNVNTLSAVYADIATLKTKVLTADVITSTMLKSDTALITKLFATDANVNILTAKSAFINAIKAVTISADKITGGTINGANVNVINLNANSIVTGTLSGINISGVNFTGTNMTLQNRLTIATDYGGVYGNFDFANDVDGTFNPRYFRGNYRLGTNHLNLQSDNYKIASGGTSGSHLGYSETYYGSDYLKMRIYNNSTNLAIKSRVDITSGFIQIADNFNDAAGVLLLPDGSVNASTADIRGLLKVGTDINVVGQSIIGGRLDVSGSSLLRSTLDVQGSTIFRTTVDIKGSTIFRSSIDSEGSSIFRSSLDVRGNIIATGAYNNTYSSAANLFISSNGYIGRATSATKYKLNISEIDLSTGYADKVLTLKPKQWVDKRQLEQTGVAEIYYGLIAEDLVNLGLDKYVQRGMNGEVEGIMYDRLWTLLIPIVKEQSEEIKELKNKIEKLESVYNE